MHRYPLKKAFLTAVICLGGILPVWAEPSQEETFFMRGQIYAGQKEYDKAVAEYLQAVEINPKYEKAYISLGLIYAMRKQYKRAISQFDKALKINPKARLAYKGLGMVYKDDGNKKAALDAFEQYLKLTEKAEEKQEIKALVSRLRKELGLEAIPDLPPQQSEKTASPTPPPAMEKKPDTPPKQPESKGAPVDKETKPSG